MSQLNPGLKLWIHFVRSGLILSSYQPIGFAREETPWKSFRYTDLNFDVFMISLIHATFTAHLILLYLAIMFMLSYESLC